MIDQQLWYHRSPVRGLMHVDVDRAYLCSLNKALPTTRSSTLDLTDNNARAKTTQPKQSTVPLPLTRVTVRQQLTRYYLTTDREACVALSKSDYDLVRFHCAFVLVRYARRSRAHTRDRFIARRYTLHSTANPACCAHVRLTLAC